MVDLVGRESTEEAELVDNCRRVRQQLADRGPALTVTCKRSLAPHQSGESRIDKGEALALDQTGRRCLSIEFLESLLVLEEFELAGCTGHVEKYHPSSLGSMMQPSANTGPGLAGDELLHGHGAQTQPSKLEELSAPELQAVFSRFALHRSSSL